MSDMSTRFVHCFSILSFYLLLISGSRVAGTPPPETIQDDPISKQEDWVPFSSSIPISQLDTVPIVNPTTPGTTSPIVNPSSPPVTTTPTTPTTPTIPTTTPPTTTTPATPTTTPPSTTTPTSSGGSWCIASPSASETALQVALDYACGYGGADCSAIQQGGSCYDPNTLKDHASYAFNDYYQKNPAPTSCVFGGTAQLANADPSTGNCHYATPKTTTSSSPPPPSMTTPTITTPTTMTPPDYTTPATPGGSTVYGVAEPTGLPSSANPVSSSLALIFLTAGFVELLFAAIHL